MFITPVMPQHSGMGLAMRAAVQLQALMRAFDTSVLLLPVVETGSTRNRFAVEFPGARLEVMDHGGEVDPYFAMISRLGDTAEQLLHFGRYGKQSLAAAVTQSVTGQVAARVMAEGAVLVHVFRSYLAGTLEHVPREIVRSIDLDEDDVSSFQSSASAFAVSGERLAARWAQLEAAAFERLYATKLAPFRSITLANPDDVPRVAARHPGLPLRAMPNCIAVPRLNAIVPRNGNATMLFVGSLRYAPNVDGLLWFIRSVLPRIPGARLRIVGRKPAAALLAHARPGRVEFSGYVDDIASAYREARLAIAPMRSGGGTRLKILEAAAHGVPVVATSAAAEGLWTAEPPWGVAADNEHRFALACRQLLAHPHEAMRLGRRGRHAVSRRYGSERIVRQWTELFHDISKGQPA